MNKPNYSTACQELLEDRTPVEWISFLFDLQNSLIANNHFEGFSKQGFQEHAEYFGSLKNFFSELQD